MEPRGLLTFAACFALLTGVAFGQVETFDLVTFAPPAGTRSSGDGFVGFTEATPTAFCQMAVYRSAPGSGDAARDFGVEWDLLVGKPTAPRRLPAR
jgi:hypothetical protein